ncbi:uncharacterized protein LOC106167502 [Lingula anatina]|uniref:Uncharacterized protein LOC106167502 n=1 Tax=Lingula anatina TaxID=7574 RepID=A0A1S3IUJ5_LINAN|nr:uncharacterized protein LOC106167502 [Lingula anatina]|eukprot:XP_013401748.1 uncharacterized protein LOC106167502 [Lingula anatina]
MIPTILELLVLILVVLIAAVTPECYKCKSSRYYSPTNSEFVDQTLGRLLRVDADCQDGKSRNTEHCPFGCYKTQATVSLRMSTYDQEKVIVDTLVRDCASETEEKSDGSSSTTTSQKCHILMKNDTSQRTKLLMTSFQLFATVEDIKGTICTCTADLCNGAVNINQATSAATLWLLLVSCLAASAIWSWTS